VLITAAFPSIPYVASAVAAWDEHIQQQKLKQSQQQPGRQEDTQDE
jgi:hypothetical protein